jgi:thiol-disulfide isomerase/thioredoxin
MNQRAWEFLWCVAVQACLLFVLTAACSSKPTPPIDFPDGPRPLTVEEFTKLQDDLRKERAPKVPAEQVVAVWDFYADWCRPCRASKPAIDQLERDGYDVRRLDVETDAGRSLSKSCQVASLPTFIVLLNHVEVFRTHDVQALKRKLADLPKPITKTASE